MGYFSQDHKESIQPGATLLEWLHEFDPMASQQELRGLLGQMLFSGEDATKRTENLSGGEAARLIFCRLMLQKPNFLLLDEPTNHLDLESINALNIALQKYDGTVLLVTHDHDLVEEVATRIWHFENRDDRRLQGSLRRLSHAEGSNHGVEPAAIAARVMSILSRNGITGVFRRPRT